MRNQKGERRVKTYADVEVAGVLVGIDHDDAVLSCVLNFCVYAYLTNEVANRFFGWRVSASKVI